MRIPGATYRVQLNGSFTLDDARALVPFLQSLGVSDLYASPVLTARPGSTHGYDVVDPTRIDPELGGAAAFNRLTDTLHEYGMGLVLDIVPNHMAASAANPWWVDVLENGRASRYASFFDIEWGAQDDKVLVPVLGAPYGNVLEEGGFTLELGPDGIWVRYEDHRYPLDPATYRTVLQYDVDRVRDDAARRALDAAARSSRSIPPRSASDPSSATERARRSATLKRTLWRIHESEPAVRKHLDETVRTVNGRRGDPASFDALDELLAAQAYRLSFWRLAGREVNYRRFFDVTELVALRTERAEVFDATHGLILELVGVGRVTGLRIDHIDGLLDPRGYLDRLRGSAGDVPIVVEKILARDEHLPRGWAADGTTGYEFAAAVGGLGIDHRGERELIRLGDAFAGTAARFGDLLYEAKLHVIGDLFPGRLASLAERLHRLAHDDRHARDLTIDQITTALAAVTAALPVYRTYLRDNAVSEDDRRTLESALRSARARVGRDARPAVDFVGRVLLVRCEPGTARCDDWLAFAMRWQQFTAPATAKGLEDTALYAYCRLASSNEVGQHPLGASRTPQEVHAFLSERRRTQPLSLNTSSTHDMKRSEDVRARIGVLSQLADAWAERFGRWHELLPPGEASGGPAPDGNEEILFFQTLIGVYPPDRRHDRSLVRRLQDYMVKAAREAKRNTSWITKNLEYETAVKRYVGRAFDDAGFIDDLRSFVAVVAPHGALSSLAGVVVKSAAPGVPDFYQGIEAWNDSLVDPDNRRPVEHREVSKMLEGILADHREPMEVGSSYLAAWPDGRIKLLVTTKALAARRTWPRLFSSGDYVALPGTSPHVFAFGRRHEGRWTIAAVPRLTARFGWPIRERVWHRAILAMPPDAPQSWTNVFTGASVRVHDGRLPIREAFAGVPLALLVPTTG